MNQPECTLLGICIFKRDTFLDVLWPRNTNSISRMCLYGTLVSYCKSSQPYLLLKPPLQQPGPSRLWSPPWKCNLTVPQPHLPEHLSLACQPGNALGIHSCTIWKHRRNNAGGASPDLWRMVKERWWLNSSPLYSQADSSFFILF